MLKVVKPGGVISVTDVDALSIILHPYNKITEIVLKQMHECFVNPSIGRYLPQLFLENNLENITVMPELSMIRDFNKLSQIFQFEQIIQDAVNINRLTYLEGQNWLENMYTASLEGNFLYCITIFTVIGYLPVRKDNSLY